jgi:hypothetical protein
MTGDIRPTIARLFAELKRAPLKTFSDERKPVDAPNDNGGDSIDIASSSA